MALLVVLSLTLSGSRTLGGTFCCRRCYTISAEGRSGRVARVPVVPVPCPRFSSLTCSALATMNICESSKSALYASPQASTGAGSHSFYSRSPRQCVRPRSPCPGPRYYRKRTPCPPRGAAPSQPIPPHCSLPTGIGPPHRPCHLAPHAPSPIWSRSDWEATSDYFLKLGFV